MSNSRLDKSPSTHQKAAVAASTQGSLSYPVRRMRNTAVLVKWIEEHQGNPYPTKAEKQYLAYYSGMNLTQLSTWFANARRRIKKIGMKTWLEGRSTFTVDFFPTTGTATASLQARPTMDYGGAGSYAYAGYTPLNSYTAAAHQHSPILHTTAQRLPNGASSIYADTSLVQQGTVSSASLNGLYGSAHRSSISQPMMPLGMHASAYWPMASATPLLPATTVSRHGSSNTAPLHSPITAQVYTTDTSHLRTHSAQSSLEVSDGTYSLQQHSPDQMLPECASTEPMLEGQKSQSSIS